MTCDMPEPCKCPSLDNCQNRFLWTHKEVGLALLPVVGRVLQVGDTETFPYALGFESLNPFFQSASRVHVSQTFRSSIFSFSPFSSCCSLFFFFSVAVSPIPTFRLVICLPQNSFPSSSVLNSSLPCYFIFVYIDVLVLALPDEMLALFSPNSIQI